MSDTYTFGDSDAARRRLDLVARLFAPATDALLDRWAPDRPEVALDLGCGPGNTTAALARRCRPRRLVAIDASPAMVAATAARLAERPEVEAVVADVNGPLPGAPAELIHARYLLAHLPDPAAAVDRWCRQLTPGGGVLVDEIERIDTTIGPFRAYLDTVADMLASRGTDLYAGAGLAAHDTAAARLTGSEAVVLPQPTGPVAAMFSLNLAEWRTDPWVAAHRDRRFLDDLAADLAGLAERPEDRGGDITWTHRQLRWTGR